MLQKAKDMITWGEIRGDVLEKLLRKRGKLEGNKKLSDEYVKSQTQFSSIAEFAEAVLSSRIELSALPKLKKVFRLRPPSKGYEATKRPFKDMGSLGYRGERINDLLARMI
jgi:large subunit ribosomal protein L30